MSRDKCDLGEDPLSLFAPFAAAAGRLTCLFLQAEPFRGDPEVLVGIRQVTRLELILKALFSASFNVVQHGIRYQTAAVSFSRNPVQHSEGALRQHDVDAFVHWAVQLQPYTRCMWMSIGNSRGRRGSFSGCSRHRRRCGACGRVEEFGVGVFYGREVTLLESAAALALNVRY